MSKMQLGFQFKQFFVAHDLCAMKVNTDGILLGAYVPVLGKKAILDIGTGSGLIAIMLAQRAEFANVLGVELLADAAQQAAANFKQSPFHERLNLYCGSIQSYVNQYNKIDESPTKFDLIVSNPPFYSSYVQSRNIARDIARSNITLSDEELILSVNKLLNYDGEFYVILPSEAMERFLLTLERLTQPERNVNLAENSLAVEEGIDLILTDKLAIFALPNKPVKRFILGFSRRHKSKLPNHEILYAEQQNTEQLRTARSTTQKSTTERTAHFTEVRTLTICDAPNQYTQAYKTLTQDFYLKH